jgi:hypothetical protein
VPADRKRTHTTSVVCASKLGLIALPLVSPGSVEPLLSFSEQGSDNGGTLAGVASMPHFTLFELPTSVQNEASGLLHVKS